MYDLVDERAGRAAATATAAGTSAATVFADAKVLGYGHLGDGNLHLNVSSPAGYDAAMERVRNRSCTVDGEAERLRELASAR